MGNASWDTQEEMILKMQETNPENRTAKRKVLPSKSELLGSTIVTRGGQLTRVNDKLFLVNSPDRNVPRTKTADEVRWNENKLKCQCPRFFPSKRPCEHIHSVNILLKLPQIIMANMDAIEGACPKCG